MNPNPPMQQHGPPAYTIGTPLEMGFAEIALAEQRLREAFGGEYLFIGDQHDPTGRWLTFFERNWLPDGQG